MQAPPALHIQTKETRTMQHFLPQRFSDTIVPGAFSKDTFPIELNKAKFTLLFCQGIYYAGLEELSEGCNKFVKIYLVRR
jgi:hypothetical protein